jgi:hypothetical protein
MESTLLAFDQTEDQYDSEYDDSSPIISEI